MVQEDLAVFTEAKIIDGKPAWMTAGSYLVEKVDVGNKGEAAKERIAEADTVILALGRQPKRDLTEATKGRAPELYEVGMCKSESTSWKSRTESPWHLCTRPA
jgi:hypothetical protein